MAKKIYPYRIKKDSFQIMSKVLSYPQTLDRRMDEQICRITVTTYTIAKNIKAQYQQELATDHLWQVKVLGIEDKEFLVLESCLESLEGDVVVADEQGD